MSLDVEGYIEAYFRSRPITRRRERTSRPFTWESEVGEHGTSLDVGGCMEEDFRFNVLNVCANEHCTSRHGCVCEGREHVMSLHLGVRGERARQFF